MVVLVHELQATQASHIGRMVVNRDQATDSASQLSTDSAWKSGMSMLAYLHQDSTKTRSTKSNCRLLNTSVMSSYNILSQAPGKLPRTGTSSLVETRRQRRSGGERGDVGPRG